MKINTVTGTITPDTLGRTLMHEHLLAGFPGWDADTPVAAMSFDDILARCVDMAEMLMANGVRTIVDPCPSDLGRDVRLMEKVNDKTGLNIVCATGLYNEHNGGAPYWRIKMRTSGGYKYLADLFIKEIVDGVPGTGIKAGVIKVATGTDHITDYETDVFKAAAIASQETGVPIMTHTDDGVLGDAQQVLLAEHGVPPHRVLVGHCCGTGDHAYHMRIARGGSYLGFDRFGIETIRPDTDRAQSLLTVIKAGAGDRVIVSHDTVWCFRGEMFPAHVMRRIQETNHPMRFFNAIVPMLRAGGATEREIDALTQENPRRFFEGHPLNVISDDGKSLN